MKKQLTSIFICTTIALSLASCNYGKEMKNAYINMDYEIFEIPIVSGSKSIKDGNINIGKKYVIYFNAFFDLFVNSLKKKEIVDVQMTVFLGPLDDREQNLLNGVNRPEGGFPYSAVGNGEWRANFVLSSQTVPPDLKKTPFNIWAYTIGNDPSQAITLKMESKTTNFYLNSSSKFSISINLNKGYFNFEKENNIVQYSNYTADLTLPIQASQIKITYYTDDTKTKALGNILYDNTAEKINFDFANHIAKLFYNVNEPTTAQILNIRNNIAAGEYDKYFVRFEADGGKNYNNVAFEYHPFI